MKSFFSFNRISLSIFAATLVSTLAHANGEFTRQMEVDRFPECKVSNKETIIGHSSVFEVDESTGNVGILSYVTTSSNDSDSTLGHDCPSRANIPRMKLDKENNLLLDLDDETIVCGFLKKRRIFMSSIILNGNCVPQRRIKKDENGNLVNVVIIAIK